MTQALDLVFFGPLGLALAAKDALPAWVDDGRNRILHQVDVARVVGEHVTRHGQKVVKRTLVGLGVMPGPPPPPTRRHPAEPDRQGDGRAGAAQPDAKSNGRHATGSGAAAAAGPRNRSAPAGPPRDRGTPGPPARGDDRPFAGGDISVDGSTEVGGPARQWPEPGGSASAQLAIPGYDSLSAFQVVQRLPGLAPPGLESVRAYEAAGRGRRTILTKISQLQSGRA